MAFDFLVVTVSFYLAYFIRSRFGVMDPLELYIVLLPPYLILWGFLLYRSGLYTSFRTIDISDVLYKIFRAAFFGLLIFSTGIYVFKIFRPSRSFVAMIFMLPTLVISLENIGVMLFFRQLRKQGFNYRNIILVGTGRRAQNFIDLVQQHSEWGLKILGLVDDDPERINTEIKGLKVIGAFKDFPKIMHNNVVDEVVFVVPRSWLDRVQDMVYFCETEGVRADVAVDIFDLHFAKAKQTELRGYPLLTFDTTPDKLWHLLVKRLVDFIAAFLGLIILLPLFIVVAILIKSTTPGPVFFSQQRSGLSGRKFRLFKFRTMVVGAEEKLKDLLHKNEMNGPVFKLKDDPRINPVGKILRKFSIDELPQLWNVFWGDMSLVGPRPPLPSEVKQYDNWHRRRLSMRPGITCLWQVSGRNKITDFDKWMKLDLEYIDKWSLWLDVKILLKTIPVVVFGIGAK